VQNESEEWEKGYKIQNLKNRDIGISLVFTLEKRKEEVVAGKCLKLYADTVNSSYHMTTICLTA
jgi:hypothetical protein